MQEIIQIAKWRVSPKHLILLQIPKNKKLEIYNLDLRGKNGNTSNKSKEKERWCGDSFIRQIERILSESIHQPPLLSANIPSRGYLYFLLTKSQKKREHPETKVAALYTSLFRFVFTKYNSVLLKYVEKLKNSCHSNLETILKLNNYIVFWRE